MPQTYRIASDNSEIEVITENFTRKRYDKVAKRHYDEPLANPTITVKYTKSQTKEGKEVTFTKADFEKYKNMGNIVEI
jgi:hypothetical protein